MYKISIQDAKSSVVVLSNYSNIDKCFYPEDSYIVKNLCSLFFFFEKQNVVQKKIKDVSYFVELIE